MSLRIALDYRPALWTARGIGRYVRNLVPALLEADESLHLELFGVFLRGRKVLREHVFPDPQRAPLRHWPLPARALPKLARFLPVSAQSLCGPFDLFHDTDYVVTPTGKRPRVVTVYDTAWLGDRGFVDGPQAKRMEATVRQLVQGASRVICISKFCASEFIEGLGVPEELVSVTPLGVDPAFHAAPDSEAIAAATQAAGVRGPYLLHLGTLEPRKNIVRLIRAFARVAEEAPEQELLLVGRQGFAAQRVFDEIARQGLTQQVRWLGNLDDASIVALMQGAAAVACPSLYEGFGLPALEAMATGAPVLASDGHALREVCGDGALLVDPLDEGEMAEGLRTLLLDRAEALEIADRGQERARRFTWAATAEATLQAYRAALA